MDTVSQAQKVIRDLEDQKENLLGRIKALAVQRQQISHAAYTGNDSAKKQLDGLNAKTTTMGLELENINAAIREANTILETAHAADARAADHEKAKQIAALNAKLKEELENADDAFSDAISSVLSARDLLAEMHSLGVTSPIEQLFKINAVAAIKTVIQKLPGPYINDFEFMRLSPGQKKEFKALATAWCDQIARQTEQRLGAAKKEAA